MEPFAEVVESGTVVVAPTAAVLAVPTVVRAGTGFEEDAVGGGAEVETVESGCIVGFCWRAEATAGGTVVEVTGGAVVVVPATVGIPVIPTDETVLDTANG